MLSKLTRKDMLIFAVLIFFACLSWLSILDKIAYNMNLDSIKETSIAFGMIKLLESILSIGSHYPVIGSVLIPLEEFLQQMSWVMLVSLMSLGLQKVIITVMQSFIINAVLTISILTLIAIKINNVFSEEWFNKILKFTFLLLFIRFAIPLMTFATMSIESGTKQMQDEISKERIVKLQEKLTKINELVTNDDNIKKEKELKIDSLKKQIEVFEKDKSQIKLDIKAIENNENNKVKNTDKSLLEKASNIFSDELTPKAKEEVTEKNLKIDSINKQIKMTKDEIDNNDSWFDFGLKHKIDSAIANIKAYMEETFDALITMIVLFFFKNVLFPILFIWALFKLVDRAFNTNSEARLKKLIDERILK